MDMAILSVKSVDSAIDSYEKGVSSKDQIFEWSEQLRVMQSDITELAMELIARYQPVATDLRFIRSCMEISYGFSRYGRYAYDIADMLETIGSLSNCDKKPVLEVAGIAREMIQLSVTALRTKDKDVVKKLYAMDDIIDSLYRKHLREAIAPASKENMSEMIHNPRCYISELMILRYLERIADHTCYIGDSIHYIATAMPSPRR
jgi:phosphate transport system protein